MKQLQFHTAVQNSCLREKSLVLDYKKLARASATTMEKKRNKQFIKITQFEKPGSIDKLFH